jgi:hypothetical protein
MQSPLPDFADAVGGISEPDLPDSVVRDHVLWQTNLHLSC